MKHLCECRQRSRISKILAAEQKKLQEKRAKHGEQQFSCTHKHRLLGNGSAMAGRTRQVAEGPEGGDVLLDDCSKLPTQLLTFGHVRVRESDSPQVLVCLDFGHFYHWHSNCQFFAAQFAIVLDSFCLSGCVRD